MAEIAEEQSASEPAGGGSILLAHGVAFEINRNRETGAFQAIVGQERVGFITIADIESWPQVEKLVRAAVLDLYGHAI